MKLRPDQLAKKSIFFTVSGSKFSALSRGIAFFVQFVLFRAEKMIFDGFLRVRDRENTCDIVACAISHLGCRLVATCTDGVHTTEKGFHWCSAVQSSVHSQS